MTKVAILGKTGMLGSAVSKEFTESDLELVFLSRKELDAEIASVKDIENISQGCDYIINCIGIIKPYIQDCDSYSVERAIRVNALFPHNLAKAAEIVGAKVIQIATDCVYDGKSGCYDENSKHNPIDVYGKTKSLGEVYASNVLNLRCSIIGKEEKSYLSLLEWFLNQPLGASVKGFKNHYWNGITTNAFAKICLGIIKSGNWFSGIQHVIPADRLSKAEMLHIFSRVFKRNDIFIEDIITDSYLDRTLETVNKKINLELWENAGYKFIPKIEEMITELL